MSSQVWKTITAVVSLMKKQLLLGVLLIAATASFSQTKPSFGIEAGITSSSIKGDAAKGLDQLVGFANGAITTAPKNGIYAGVNADFPISSNFSINPGLTYTQRGYEMMGEMTIKGAEVLSPSAKATLTSHYIDLPVLLKGNFNGLQVFVGPQVSYLASADLKTSAGVAGFNFFKKTFDASNQLNQWDAGVKAGVGYQFDNGINLAASYDHGLMKTDANKNFDAYNRSLKVGIGFRF